MSETPDESREAWVKGREQANGDDAEPIGPPPEQDDGDQDDGNDDLEPDNPDGADEGK